MMHYLMHLTPGNTRKCTETPGNRAGKTGPKIDRNHSKSTTYRENQPLAFVGGPHDGLDGRTRRGRINTGIFLGTVVSDALNCAYVGLAQFTGASICWRKLPWGLCRGHGTFDFFAGPDADLRGKPPVADFAFAVMLMA
jgi:hypothetical protein